MPTRPSAVTSSSRTIAKPRTTSSWPASRRGRAVCLRRLEREVEVVERGQQLLGELVAPRSAAAAFSRAIRLR